MINRRTLFVSGLSAAGLAAAGVVIGRDSLSAATATVGIPAPVFAVPDTEGRTWKLEEFRGKTVVLEWTSPSCPFVAAHYRGGNMQSLQRWATEQGVIWLSILSTHPSRRDYLPPDQAQAFNRARDDAPTALLMDPQGELGRAYGARTTPHMFVIAATGALAYAGAIDDNPTTDSGEIAKSRNLVRAALEDIEAGRPVAIASTRAYGCVVGYGS